MVPAGRMCSRRLKHALLLLLLTAWLAGPAHAFFLWPSRKAVAADSSPSQDGVEVAGGAQDPHEREDYTSTHLQHILGEKGDWLHTHDPSDPFGVKGHELHVHGRITAHLRSETASVRERIMADRPRKAKFPHASECNFCGKCSLTDSAEDTALNKGQLGGTSPILSLFQTHQDPDSDAMKHYAPWVDNRNGLKNCTKCRGCTSILNDLQSVLVDFKGAEIAPKEGRSRSIVYRASSEQAAHGLAIGKVVCLPFSKTLTWKFRDAKEILEPCDETFTEFLKTKQYPTIMAADLISKDCGLDSIVPRTWVENITAIVPGSGYVVQTEMQMQDIVKGVSLTSMHRHVSDHDGEKLLASINSTTVVLSAIYDLLLASEDRHNDNVLIDSQGHMALIDNDKVLNLESGIPESVFFPTSMYMWYNLVGRKYANSHGREGERSRPNYNLMLDYRCHVKSVNGAYDQSFTLGTNYPTQVKQCLRRMDSMSIEQLMNTYKLPDTQSADGLKSRVGDMLHKGFEAALENSTPYCKRMPWTKPCCSWKGSNTRNREECADPAWDPNTWSTTNCVKTGHLEYQELHGKSNWQYVSPDVHKPSIEERALQLK